jgi:hypothetical protein
MAIIIRDVVDEDIPRACEIESAAYAKNPLSPIFFPGPHPPDAQQRRITQLIQMRKNDPTAHYVQAYDEETGQMIAFAKWHVYDTPEAAAASQRPTRTFGPDTNREACEAFFGGLVAKKKELVGQKMHIRTAYNLLSPPSMAKSSRPQYVADRSSLSGSRCRGHARGMGH